jgi:arsenate reductase-like glutaredoxin family protein
MRGSFATFIPTKDKKPRQDNTDDKRSDDSRRVPRILCSSPDNMLPLPCIVQRGECAHHDKGSRIRSDEDSMIMHPR